MPTLVVVFRIVPLLGFTGAMVLARGEHREGVKPFPRQPGSDRSPVVANFAAFGLYLSSLLVFAGSATTSSALLLAATGSLVALAGVGIFVRSRAELGAAWSLAPRAHHETGLITTGPYRLVRHPIYLGLTLLSLGEALAFASWVAVLIVGAGIVPTFLWRARAEEKQLGLTFGDQYTAYRKRTGMIVPPFH